MNVFLFCFLFFGESIPINVKIGDPIIDLPLVALETGVETNLKDILDDGFAFFLSTECDVCVAAMPHFSYVEDKHMTIYIFAGNEAKIRSFIKKHKVNLGTSFIVLEKHLVPYGLVTLPAALTYQDGRNRVAMHGAMTPDNLRRLVLIHERGYIVRRENDTP